ncbi:MAG TPA: transglutaminase domain-containing protein [Pseudoneobacillus sp.]|nr:transglutaminase domain-containing protein [Pseudoneobacillus sp.]
MTSKKSMKWVVLLVLVVFTFSFGLPTKELAFAKSIENIKQASANIKYDKPTTTTTLGSFVETLLEYVEKMNTSLEEGNLRELREQAKGTKKALKDIRKNIDLELAENGKTLDKLKAIKAKMKHDQLKADLDKKLDGFEALLDKLDELSTLVKELKGKDKDALKTKLDEIEKILNPEQPHQPLGALPHSNANITPPEPATGGGITPAYVGMEQSISSNQGLSITPVEGDLAETPETKLTSKIKELADSLKTPVKIYEYVKNNIDFVPYYGSRKGATGTLHQMTGNDYDQASLLISMLRYKDIPARYVNGTVQVPIEKVKSWTGAPTPEAAIKVISSLGIPTVSLVSGGKIIGARFEHTWVEAYVPYENYRGIGAKKGKKIWVPLDPSFKQYKVEKGLDILEITGVSEEQIVDAFKMKGNESIYGSSISNLDISDLSSFIDGSTEKIEQYIADHHLEDTDAKELIGGKRIIPENLGLLPVTLPYKTVTVLSETNTIPLSSSEKIGFSIKGNDPFNLNFTGEDDFHVEFRAVELYGKRITLSWIPATQEDEEIIEEYGGLFKTPAYMLQLKPQLKADGGIIAEGKAVGFGNRQQFTIAMGHAGRPVENVINPVTAGGFYSISFDYGKIDVEELQTIKDRIMAVKDTATEDSIYTDEVMGEILNSVGKSYFAQLDAFNSVAANAYQVSSIRQVSEAMTGYQPNVKYMFFSPFEVTGGSFFIDVDHDVFGVVSLDGKKEKEVSYMMNSGVIGSAMEHGIHEQIFQVPSVSSIKILTEASKRGIPIYTISKDNIDQLNEITVSSSVKTDIQNAVNSGKVVTIPQKEFSYYDWHGAGYIVMDPSTGAAGYMISGGLAGGSAAIDIGVNLVGLAALAWAIFDVITIAMAFLAATSPIMMFVFFALFVIALIALVMTLENIIMYWKTGDYKYASALMGDLIMNMSVFGIFKVLDKVLPGLTALFKGVKNQMDDVARAADNIGDDLAEDIARIDGPEKLPQAEQVINDLNTSGVDPNLISKVADEQGLDGLTSLKNLLEKTKCVTAAITIASCNPILTEQQIANFVKQGLDLKTIVKFLDEGWSVDSAVQLTKATEDGILTPNAWNGKLVSQSGDATHLTERELSAINKVLKEGKDVDADVIKSLKNQANNLADTYVSKINDLSADTLANLSKTYGDSTAPSKILSDELANAGITRPADVETHHIVPAKQAGQDIVNILQRNGIHINSAANGVHLPAIDNPAWPGQVTHNAFLNLTDSGNPMFRHGQVYIDYIASNIRAIDEAGLGRDVMIDFLNETRQKLLNGEIDFLYKDLE